MTNPPTNQKPAPANRPAPSTALAEALPVDDDSSTDGSDFDVDANVDPDHVEPVGTTLGEPAKEHWDTKVPPKPTE
jgi:hypothetical protein